MDGTTFESLLNLYEKKLSLPTNSHCDACDVNRKEPLMAWHVGSQFHDATKRILFVGKPHRGCPGVSLPTKIIDPRSKVESTLRWSKWAYWRYTLDIARAIHGENAWSRIAMTNLVKCTNVDTDGASTDRTSRTMVEQCAQRLGVIDEEVSLLRPTHIVLYTASFFPDIVQTLSLGAMRGWKTVWDGKKSCGRKRLRWHERVGESDWGDPLKSLIVGHPERMKRDDYVRLVSNWVQMV